jgi:hypothetical protein
MKRAILAVLFLAAVGYAADSVDVVDVVVPQQTVIISEHVEYPTWRYTGDSAIKRFDVISIRFLHRRQGGAVVKDMKMNWRPTESGVTADSVKAFLKFNTVR